MEAEVPRHPALQSCIFLILRRPWSAELRRTQTDRLGGETGGGMEAGRTGGKGGKKDRREEEEGREGREDGGRIYID